MSASSTTDRRAEFQAAALERAVARIEPLLLSQVETTAFPVLILLSGLPGTGKTYVARALVAQVSCLIVESDFVRKTLYPQPTYSAGESAWVHRVCHTLIERQLAQGRRVIYDATNLTEWHREMVCRLAERAGARVVAVRVTAPAEVVRERLTRRLETERAGDDYSDATWEVYQRLVRSDEPIRRAHLVVDTSQGVEAAIAKILRAMSQ